MSHHQNEARLNTKQQKAHSTHPTSTSAACLRNCQFGILNCNLGCPTMLLTQGSVFLVFVCDTSGIVLLFLLLCTHFAIFSLLVYFSYLLQSHLASLHARSCCFFWFHVACDFPVTWLLCVVFSSFGFSLLLSAAVLYLTRAVFFSLLLCPPL